MFDKDDKNHLMCKDENAVIKHNIIKIEENCNFLIMYAKALPFYPLVLFSSLLMKHNLIFGKKRKTA